LVAMHCFATDYVQRLTGTSPYTLTPSQRNDYLKLNLGEGVDPNVYGD
jgi:hypothetical protein